MVLVLFIYYFLNNIQLNYKCDCIEAAQELLINTDNNTPNPTLSPIASSPTILVPVLILQFDHLLIQQFILQINLRTVQVLNLQLNRQSIQHLHPHAIISRPLSQVFIQVFFHLIHLVCHLVIYQVIFQQEYHLKYLQINHHNHPFLSKYLQIFQPKTHPIFQHLYQQYNLLSYQLKWFNSSHHFHIQK